MRIDKFILMAFLSALPTMGLADDYCPNANEIVIQDGHYMAQTSIGKWVSQTPATQTDLSTLVFWQAKGWPVGNTGSSIVKINKLYCAYFSITSSFSVFLVSPGFPAQTFSVQKRDYGWGLYAEGFMDCLSTNQSIMDCPFRKG